MEDREITNLSSTTFGRSVMANKLIAYIHRVHHSRHEVVERLGTFTRGRKQYEIHYLKESVCDLQGTIEFRRADSLFKFEFSTLDYPQTLKNLRFAIDDILDRETMWEWGNKVDIKQKSERDVRIFLRLLSRKILWISDPLVAIPSEEDPDDINEASLYLAKTAGWIRNSFCLCKALRWVHWRNRRRKEKRLYSRGFNIFRLNREALISLRNAINEIGDGDRGKNIY